MTGTWLLIGATIGLAAAIGIGYLRGRHIYQTQLEQFEPQIPSWVNQGNRAVIGQYEEILAMIHEAAHIELWEHQFKKEQGVGE